MNDGAVKRNEEVEWTTDYTARKLEDPVFDAFRRSSEHESWFNVLRVSSVFLFCQEWFFFLWVMMGGGGNERSWMWILFFW